MQGSWFIVIRITTAIAKLVDNPVAVDPDEKLTAFAKAADWPIISLRQGKCPYDIFISNELRCINYPYWSKYQTSIRQVSKEFIIGDSVYTIHLSQF